MHIRANPLNERSEEMMDLIFIAATVAFFAIAWAYTLGCDRL